MTVLFERHVRVYKPGPSFGFLSYHLVAFERNGDDLFVAGPPKWCLSRADAATRPSANAGTHAFNQTDLNGVYPEPTLQLDHQQTQELMDSLWDCGIRPTEGTGSAGAMAAMQKHLEDMRTLVFKK